MATTASGRPPAISEYELDLEPPETERWLGVAAAASGCRPDELTIECASRPVFLTGGAVLLLLRYRARVPAAEQSWWPAGEPDAARETELWCVAGRGRSGDTAPSGDDATGSAPAAAPVDAAAEPEAAPGSVPAAAVDAAAAATDASPAAPAGSRPGDASPSWALPLRNSGDLVTAVRSSNAFQIDAETVLDYLRVFVDLGRTGDSTLAASNTLLLEDVDEATFWTPLNEVETRALRSHLEQNRLRRPDGVGHGYRVVAVTLVGDELRRLGYTIYDRTVEGLGEPSAERGEIRVARLDDEPALLSGLPANYLRPLGARPTGTAGRYGYLPDAKGWRRIAPVEANALVADLNRRLLPLVSCDRLTEIALQPLPFYPLDLLRIRGCIHNGRRLDRYVLWRPGFAWSLDTRSNWINDLNEHLVRHFNWSLTTPADVAAYLKFFGDFVWGPNGPFRIVTRGEEATPPAADPATAAVSADAKALLGADRDLSAEEVIGEIEEPAVEELDAEGAWPAVAFVLFGGDLFAAKFRIRPHGRVEMVGDRPLVGWQAREGAAWAPAAPAEGLLPPIAPETEQALEPMTAEAFVAALRSAQESGTGRPTEIRRRVICGRVDLRGEAIGSVVVTDCRFRGVVNLDHLGCSRDLTFRHCVFENGLRMAEATIAGRLHLLDVVVRGYVPLSEQESNAQGGSVSLTCHESSAGYVTFARVSLDGSLLAERLRVQNNVELLSVQTLRGIDLMSSKIGRDLVVASESAAFPACIYGDLELGHIESHSILLRGLFVLLDLNLEYAFAEQRIALEGLYLEDPGGSGPGSVLPLRVGYSPDGEGVSGHVGGISLYGTVIEKNSLVLSGVDVAGSVEAVFVRVGTGVWIEPYADHPVRNAIGGSIGVDGAIVPQILRIRRTDVGGDLSGRGLRAGELRMAGRMTPRGGGEPAQADYEPLTFAGRMNLQDAAFEGEVYITGVRAGGSLNLRHATVGGDLTLSIDCAEALERGLAEAGDAGSGYLLAELGGGINLRKAVISGDVVLSGAQCPNAPIDMADAEVRRDVEIMPAPGRTRTTALLLDGLRCEGNIDVSGLSLSPACGDTRCPGPGCESPDCTLRRRAGHVLARGARVAGLLRSASEHASAEIPGCLDLAFSEVGTLEISVDTFPLAHGEARCEQGAEVCGVILRRATVGMLSLTVDDRGYPRPVDLGHAEIRWWQFNHRAGSDARDGEAGRIRPSSDDPRDYVALLAANERGLQRHTWRAIENNLFNWGHETAADDVHRAMRRWLRDKLRREGPAPGLFHRIMWIPRRIGRRLFDMLTREVTEPLPAVLIMLLWTVASTYLFSLPGNIGLSELGHLGLTEAQRREVKQPAPESWGVGSGFWTALHFHVPVAAFTARDEWEPANDRSLVVLDGAKPYRIRGVTPEDYANVVLVAHWFMWPVVLVLYSRRFLRRAQQQ